jgi:hypothetical protein
MSNPTLEKQREYKKRYHERHPERRKESAKKTREKYKEKQNLRCREWRALNRHKVSAYNRKMSLSRKEAAISLSKESIELINATYKAAKLFSIAYPDETFHVDHIIPIKHELVCGLHVPWNLRILTDKDNLKKKNKFDGTHENNSWRKP